MTNKLTKNELKGIVSKIEFVKKKKIPSYNHKNRQKSSKVSKIINVGNDNKFNWDEYIEDDIIFSVKNQLVVVRRKGFEDGRYKNRSLITRETSRSKSRSVLYNQAALYAGK